MGNSGHSRKCLHTISYTQYAVIEGVLSLIRQSNRCENSMGVSRESHSSMARVAATCCLAFFRLSRAASKTAQKYHPTASNPSPGDIFKPLRFHPVWIFHGVGKARAFVEVLQPS